VEGLSLAKPASSLVAAPARRSLLDRRRVRFVSLSIIGISVVVLILSALSARHGRTMLGTDLGGDFACFYSAGAILNEGRADHLYDVWLQSQHYHQLMPDEAPEAALPYAYPPVVAAVFRPLAMLPYPVAFGVWVCMTVAMYAAGLWFLWDACPGIARDDRWIAVLVSLAFEPFIIECLHGGQLSAVAFALVCAAVWLDRRISSFPPPVLRGRVRVGAGDLDGQIAIREHSEKGVTCRFQSEKRKVTPFERSNPHPGPPPEYRRRGMKVRTQLVSGFALGLTLYKPTLLPIVFLMLLVSRRWRMLAGTFCGGLAILAASVAATGWIGLRQYFHVLSTYGRQAAGSEAFFRTWKFVDLNSFTKLLLGQQTGWAAVCLLIVIALIAAPLAYRLWRGSASGLSLRADAWASAIAGSLVVNLYVGVYDTVLLVPAIWLIAEAALAQKTPTITLPRSTTRLSSSKFGGGNNGNAVRMLLIVAFVAPWFSQSLAMHIGLQPFTLVIAAVAAFPLVRFIQGCTTTPANLRSAPL
jgi:hypothetical protein